MKLFSRIWASKSQSRQPAQTGVLPRNTGVLQRNTKPLDTSLSEPSPQSSVAIIAGRRHRTDVPYTLPKDEREASRLDFQHYALRLLLNGDFCAPVPSYLKTIVDIGAGTGRWAIEVAKMFPMANVVGIDLEDVSSLVSRPSNYRFLEGNIFDGLPFSDGSIDFVHQRLMVGAIPAQKWPGVIHELVRVTAPGGWLELVESGNHFHRAGPVTQAFAQHWLKVAALLGFDSSLMAYLDDWMRDAGLKNVEMKKIPVPLGKWAGHVGEMMGRDIQAVFTAFKAIYVTRLGMSPLEFDRLVQQLLPEWDAYHTTYEFYQVYGQK